MSTYDAIIVGSGPNGLAAAITLAQNGGKVLVLEAKDTIGGGTRTAEITLPGFRHDICSAIHPSGDRITLLSQSTIEEFRAGMDLPTRSAGSSTGRWPSGNINPLPG